MRDTLLFRTHQLCLPILFFYLFLFASAAQAQLVAPERTYVSEFQYRGPCEVAVSNDGEFVYFVEQDANAVSLLCTVDNKVKSTIGMPATPTGICISPDGSKLYITCAAPEGVVCVVESASGEITSTIPVGHSARRPCIHPNGETLYVCNRFDNDISVVDLKAGKEVRRVPAAREPFDSAITPDGKTLFVSNHLPKDSSDSYDVAAIVSCIDTMTFDTTEVRMLNGVTDLAGICISGDGKFVYTVSLLARYQMPTTQLERGWMNTNALSILNANTKEFVNTVLLDDIDLGAANATDVISSSDGTQIYVSHSGTHEISVIDAGGMMEKILSLPPDQDALQASGTNHDINTSYSSSTGEEVPNDLAFLVGLRQRVKLEGNGPRGLAVFEDLLYVAEYFTDTIACIDLGDIPRPRVEQIPIGPTPQLTIERQGEIYFHDAGLCFQHWQSCASCHPDARVDALNWDLMNDGMGNPKNVKSMLLALHTPPAMISGIRADGETAVRAGIRHIQFAVRPEEDSQAIDAYIYALEPVSSPCLIDGRLSEAAERGRLLFENDDIGCSRCHPAPLYTDMEMHDVSSRGQYDRRDTFDTPTLVEVWRTYPYLHDGRYVTMEELLGEGNHGNAAAKLNEEGLADLTEYVLSL